MDGIITSTANQKVKKAKQLYSKQARRETGLFVADGRKIVLEGIRGNLVCKELYIEHTKAHLFEEILAYASGSNVQVNYVNDKVMASLASTKSPQGVVGVFIIPPQTKRMFEVDSHFIVILEGISDPGNLGTIIRTCDAVGVDAIVMYGCVDIYNDKVIRASMGSVFNVTTRSTGDAASYVHQLVMNTWQVGCGHLGGEDFYAREQGKKVALVIGNEASGVTKDTAATCSSLWKLPMRGKAESLNAAIAAGIMLYDISNKLRQ